MCKKIELGKKKQIITREQGVILGKDSTTIATTQTKSLVDSVGKIKYSNILYDVVVVVVVVLTLT